MLLARLFAGFFCEPASEDASFWDDCHANDLLQYVVYGLSSDKLTFHFCNLKAMLRAHAFFFKPASASDTAQGLNFFDDLCEDCSEWNPSWKTFVWPWLL